ncbi:hypothetical protein [uncultured Pelagimonas sp.]|uniref:hypothetical protein n=1 Tax=uncultured Pelagimonas sp. TaxID=1618102 RepID=UPI002609AF23|nr:hypothetical protein [uncultured Pelagimonas sp.]
MRQLLLVLFLIIGQVAHADFLSDNRGHWEGKGYLPSGLEWPVYIEFRSNSAKVYTPDDGCEANWSFEQVTNNLIRGWEHVTVGADRCYVGLKFVVTRHDASRIKVDWFQMNGMQVAEALLWRIQ